MKNKKLWVAIGVLLLAVVGFIAFSKKEADTEPVISETVEEVESAEPEIVEPIEEEISEETEAELVETEFNGAVDINGNPINMEDIVEGTALTQAEIDEYNATHSMKYNAEDGTVTFSDGDVYPAVGQPGEDWRRMTDEQAKEILDKGEPEPSDYSTRAEYDEAYREYQAAGAELNGFDGSDLGGKWYYDYYEWAEASHAINSHHSKIETEKEIIESTGNEYHDTSGERYVPKGLKNK